jgi:uncharacterized protein (TIGR02270 family)
VQGALPVLWDIYEEHLDEAAFLWGQRERALSASSYTLSEVAEGPEERLLAHLDGLVLGGSSVSELLLAALSDDDLGRVSASAWVLLSAEDSDHLETVWGALVAAEEGPRRRAICRALELSQRPDLPVRLLARWQGCLPEAQACVIDALSTRGAEELNEIPLQSLGAEKSPELLGAVLRALRRAPDPAYGTLIGHGLDSPLLETRAAAIEAGTLLRVRSTLGICRRLVAERAPDRRFAMGVLALDGEPSDHARLIEWARAPDLASDAIWALGFAGRADVAELLVGLLDEERVAPLAAEALSAITGLRLEGALVQPGKSSLDDAFDDDGPVPEVKAEDDLLAPHVERLRAWWQSNRSSFDPDTRYATGAVWSKSALGVAMTRAPTWRRQVWRLGLGADLAARTELRQWARRQAP